MMIDRLESIPKFRLRFRFRSLLLVTWCIPRPDDYTILLAIVRVQLHIHDGIHVVVVIMANTTTTTTRATRRQFDIQHVQVAQFGGHEPPQPRHELDQVRSRFRGR